MRKRIQRTLQKLTAIFLIIALLFTAQAPAFAQLQPSHFLQAVQNSGVGGLSGVNGYLDKLNSLGNKLTQFYNMNPNNGHEIWDTPVRSLDEAVARAREVVKILTQEGWTDEEKAEIEQKQEETKTKIEDLKSFPAEKEYRAEYCARVKAELPSQIIDDQREKVYADKVNEIQTLRNMRATEFVALNQIYDKISVMQEVGKAWQSNTPISSLKQKYVKINNEIPAPSGVVYISQPDPALDGALIEMLNEKVNEIQAINIPPSAVPALKKINDKLNKIKTQQFEPNILNEIYHDIAEVQMIRNTRPQDIEALKKVYEDSYKEKAEDLKEKEKETNELAGKLGDWCKSRDADAAINEAYDKAKAAQDNWNAAFDDLQTEDAQKYIMALKKTILTLHRSYGDSAQIGLGDHKDVFNFSKSNDLRAVKTGAAAIKQALMEAAIHIRKLEIESAESDIKIQYFTNEERNEIRDIYRNTIANSTACNWVKETENSYSDYQGYMVVNTTVKKDDVEDQAGCDIVFLAVLGLSVFGAETSRVCSADDESDACVIYNFMLKHDDSPLALNTFNLGMSALLGMKAYRTIQQFVDKAWAKEVDSQGGFLDILNFPEKIVYSGVRKYLSDASYKYAYPIDGGNGAFGNAWEDFAEMLADEGSAESIKILETAYKAFDGRRVAEGIHPFVVGALLTDKLDANKFNVHKNAYAGHVQLVLKSMFATGPGAEHSQVEKNHAIFAHLLTVNKAAAMAYFYYISGMGDLDVPTKTRVDNKLTEFYYKKVKDIKATTCMEGQCMTYAGLIRTYSPNLQAKRVAKTVLGVVDFAISIYFAYGLLKLGVSALRVAVQSIKFLGQAGIGGVRFLYQVPRLIRAGKSVAQINYILAHTESIHMFMKASRAVQKGGRVIVNMPYTIPVKLTQAQMYYPMLKANAIKNDVNVVRYAIQNHRYQKVMQIAARNNVQTIGGIDVAAAPKYATQVQINKSAADLAKLGLSTAEDGKVLSAVSEEALPDFVRTMKDLEKGAPDIIKTGGRYGRNQVDMGHTLSRKMTTEMLSDPESIRYLRMAQSNMGSQYSRWNNAYQTFRDMGYKFYKKIGDLKNSAGEYLGPVWGEIIPKNLTFHPARGYAVNNGLISGTRLPLLQTHFTSIQAPYYTMTGPNILKQTLKFYKTSDLVKPPVIQPENYGQWVSTVKTKTIDFGRWTKTQAIDFGKWSKTKTNNFGKWISRIKFERPNEPFNVRFKNWWKAQKDWADWHFAGWTTAYSPFRHIFSPRNYFWSMRTIGAGLLPSTGIAVETAAAADAIFARGVPGIVWNMTPAEGTAAAEDFIAAVGKTNPASTFPNKLYFTAKPAVPARGYQSLVMRDEWGFWSAPSGNVFGSFRLLGYNDLQSLVDNGKSIKRQRLVETEIHRKYIKEIIRDIASSRNIDDKMSNPIYKQYYNEFTQGKTESETLNQAISLLLAEAVDDMRAQISVFGATLPYRQRQAAGFFIPLTREIAAWLTGSEYLNPQQLENVEKAVEKALFNAAADYGVLDENAEIISGVLQDKDFAAVFLADLVKQLKETDIKAKDIEVIVSGIAQQLGADMPAPPQAAVAEEAPAESYAERIKNLLQTDAAQTAVKNHYFDLHDLRHTLGKIRLDSASEDITQPKELEDGSLARGMFFKSYEDFAAIFDEGFLVSKTSYGQIFTAKNWYAAKYFIGNNLRGRSLHFNGEKIGYLPVLFELDDTGFLREGSRYPIYPTDLPPTKIKRAYIGTKEGWKPLEDIIGANDNLKESAPDFNATANALAAELAAQGFDKNTFTAGYQNRQGEGNPYGFNKKVLMAGDNAQIYAESFNYYYRGGMTAFNNNSEALAYLKDQNADLIILEYNGQNLKEQIDFLKALRGSGVKTPVVLQTTDMPDIAPEYLFAVGFNGNFRTHPIFDVHNNPGLFSDALPDNALRLSAGAQSELAAMAAQYQVPAPRPDAAAKRRAIEQYNKLVSNVKKLHSVSKKEFLDMYKDSEYYFRGISLEKNADFETALAVLLTEGFRQYRLGFRRPYEFGPTPYHGIYYSKSPYLPIRYSFSLENLGIKGLDKGHSLVFAFKDNGQFYSETNYGADNYIDPGAAHRPDRVFLIVHENIDIAGGVGDGRVYELPLDIPQSDAVGGTSVDAQQTKPQPDLTSASDISRTITFDTLEGLGVPPPQKPPKPEGVWNIIKWYFQPDLSPEVPYFPVAEQAGIVYRGMQVAWPSLIKISENGLEYSETGSGVVNVLGMIAIENDFYKEGIYAGSISTANHFATAGLTTAKPIPVIIHIKKDLVDFKPSKRDGDYIYSEKDIPAQAIAEISAFLHIDGEGVWGKLEYKDNKFNFTPYKTDKPQNNGVITGFSSGANVVSPAAVSDARVAAAAKLIAANIMEHFPVIHNDTFGANSITSKTIKEQVIKALEYALPLFKETHSPRRVPLESDEEFLTIFYDILEQNLAEALPDLDPYTIRSNMLRSVETRNMALITGAERFNLPAVQAASVIVEYSEGSGPEARSYAATGTYFADPMGFSGLHVSAHFTNGRKTVNITDPDSGKNFIGEVIIEDKDIDAAIVIVRDADFAKLKTPLPMSYALPDINKSGDYLVAGFFDNLDIFNIQPGRRFRAAPVKLYGLGNTNIDKGRYGQYVHSPLTLPFMSGGGLLEMDKYGSLKIIGFNQGGINFGTKWMPVVSASLATPAPYVRMLWKKALINIFQTDPALAAWILEANPGLSKSYINVLTRFNNGWDNYRPPTKTPAPVADNAPAAQDLFSPEKAVFRVYTSMMGGGSAYLVEHTDENGVKRPLFITAGHVALRHYNNVRLENDFGYNFFGHVISLKYPETLTFKSTVRRLFLELGLADWKPSDLAPGETDDYGIILPMDLGLEPEHLRLNTITPFIISPDVLQPGQIVETHGFPGLKQYFNGRHEVLQAGPGPSFIISNNDKKIRRGSSGSVVSNGRYAYGIITSTIDGRPEVEAFGGNALMNALNSIFPRPKIQLRPPVKDRGILINNIMDGIIARFRQEQRQLLNNGQEITSALENKYILEFIDKLLSDKRLTFTQQHRENMLFLRDIARSVSAAQGPAANFNFESIANLAANNRATFYVGVSDYDSFSERSGDLISSGGFVMHVNDSQPMIALKNTVRTTLPHLQNPVVILVGNGYISPDNEQNLFYNIYDPVIPNSLYHNRYTINNTFSLITNALENKTDNFTLLLDTCHSGKAFEDLTGTSVLEQYPGAKIISPGAVYEMVYSDFDLKKEGGIFENKYIENSLRKGLLGLKYYMDGKVHFPLEEALAQAQLLEDNEQYNGVSARQIKEYLKKLLPVYAAKGGNTSEFKQAFGELPDELVIGAKNPARFASSIGYTAPKDYKSIIKVPQYLADFVADIFVNDMAKFTALDENTARPAPVSDDESVIQPFSMEYPSDRPEGAALTKTHQYTYKKEGDALVVKYGFIDAVNRKPAELEDMILKDIASAITLANKISPAEAEKHIAAVYNELSDAITEFEKTGFANTPEYKTVKTALAKFTDGFTRDSGKNIFHMRRGLNGIFLNKKNVIAWPLRSRDGSFPDVMITAGSSIDLIHQDEHIYFFNSDGIAVARGRVLASDRVIGTNDLRSDNSQPLSASDITVFVIDEVLEPALFQPVYADESPMAAGNAYYKLALGDKGIILRPAEPITNDELNKILPEGLSTARSVRDKGEIGAPLLTAAGEAAGLLVGTQMRGDVNNQFLEVEQGSFSFFIPMQRVKDFVKLAFGRTARDQNFNTAAFNSVYPGFDYTKFNPRSYGTENYLGGFYKQKKELLKKIFGTSSIKVNTDYFNFTPATTPATTQPVPVSSPNPGPSISEQPVVLVEPFKILTPENINVYVSGGFDDILNLAKHAQAEENLLRQHADGLWETWQSHLQKAESKKLAEETYKTWSEAIESNMTTPAPSPEDERIVKVAYYQDEIEYRLSVLEQKLLSYKSDETLPDYSRHISNEINDLIKEADRRIKLNTDDKHNVKGWHDFYNKAIGMQIALAENAAEKYFLASLLKPSIEVENFLYSQNGFVKQGNFIAQEQDIKSLLQDKTIIAVNDDLNELKDIGVLENYANKVIKFGGHKSAIAYVSKNPGENIIVLLDFNFDGYTNITGEEIMREMKNLNKNIIAVQYNNFSAGNIQSYALYNQFDAFINIDMAPEQLPGAIAEAVKYPVDMETAGTLDWTSFVNEVKPQMLVPTVSEVIEKYSGTDAIDIPLIEQEVLTYRGIPPENFDFQAKILSDNVAEAFLALDQALEDPAPSRHAFEYYENWVKTNKREPGQDSPSLRERMLARLSKKHHFVSIAKMTPQNRDFLFNLSIDINK